ncbi:MAG: M16 family metallopeptidase [Candidatus Kapaibacteriota bacterium]
MNRVRKLLLPIVVLFCANTITPNLYAQKTKPGKQPKPSSSAPTPAQVAPPTVSAKASDTSIPDEWRQIVPTDSAITIGKLPNGLTYYIRANKKPEKRVEMMLGVNIGSTLEDDDQRGLAHFLEHMAFNGTKNFQKQALVSYLESVGMKFGADVNASTGFDETVYFLQLPSDRDSIVRRGFQVLEDWAHNISFDSLEIEKERGVILEERRLRRNGNMRILEQQLPMLYKGSRYAERMPIGTPEVLTGFKHETLRRFYRDWYRPELMAVIVVGDIDVKETEARIKEHFSRLTAPQNPKIRTIATVPDHKGWRFSIAGDKEAMFTGVQVQTRLPHAYTQAGGQTLGAFRERLLERLYCGILSERIREIVQKPNPPFTFGGANKGRDIVRTNDAYTLAGFFIKDNNVPRALTVLLTESERVKRHGFTAGELERRKADIVRSYEKSYAEREKTESNRLAQEYLRNFLTQETLPSIGYEFEQAKKLLPGITLQEVNALNAKFMPEMNRIVNVTVSLKDSTAKLPTEQELVAAISAVESSKDIEPYKDNVSAEPLISPDKEPKPGRVFMTNTMPEVEATEWKFRNGVRVILKPTTFKNDEILFRAFSPGGSSLVSDADASSAEMSTALISESGVGTLNSIALQKRFAGKVVRVAPYIGELYEGISGSCSPKDVESALELVYAYFTQPRKDSSAFLNLKQRMQAVLENFRNAPESAFQDTLVSVLSNYHPRRKPFSKETLSAIQFDKSFQIYQERFADASDFVFTFVGNFNPDELKPLAEKYLGSLPSLKRTETWKDLGIRPPLGKAERIFKKGIDPKSTVSVRFLF